MNFKAYSQKGLYLLALLCLAGAGCNKKDKIEKLQTPEPMVLIIETNEEFLQSQQEEIIALVNTVENEEYNICQPDDSLSICEK